MIYIRQASFIKPLLAEQQSIYDIIYDMNYDINYDILGQGSIRSNAAFGRPCCCRA